MHGQARKIILSGVVQGVGFRPFIYRHAKSFGLNGWVRNVSGRVEIHVQGNLQDLDEFANTLIGRAPDLSKPVLESVRETPYTDSDEFLIHPSLADADADIHLPADLFTCDDCLRELYDPANRRYRYPFINCTQCGPRYTLIRALPYDRPNTSMSGFDLCESCLAEYTDPLDRRYHAEPVACARCGPALSYVEKGGQIVLGNEAALKSALAALDAGKVLAVKGIGGYHLVCDARNDDAVHLLRKRKPRPHKPLAVIFPAPPGNSLAILRQFLSVDDIESGLLESPARPIVLLRKKSANALSSAIAPGLNEVGAMLPYSPLHHVLLRDFGAPLVASSANISGEPVLTENRDVETRLAQVADAFLHHDRSIVRPADDPVMRVINRQPTPLRQGRGQAPLELELPFRLERPVLAVGTHMKNTIALSWDNRAVVSPHIGEMDSPRSLQTFEQCIADLGALYQVEIAQLVCDAHPRYMSTRWAHRQALPVFEIYHHHAHASAVYAEALANDNTLGDMLVFTWDGVGLGPDGSLWGGEALAGKPGQWRRVASFRPFRLPGGERAGREPWRSAAAICWEAGLDCPLKDASDPLLASFWRQGINAPVTTSAGRLFDAAAALGGVCTRASYEGQGPMLFEALAATHATLDEGQLTRLPLTKTDGVYSADWTALIPMLLKAPDPVHQRAANFHLSMADTLQQQAIRIRDDLGVNRVGLAGGVFQNRVLTEKCIELLEDDGFEVTFPTMMPVNDAGISFGQIIEYGYGNGSR
ncbi:MAG: carbamoyltransferase HypF [Lysobacterales bacterium]